MTLQITPTPSRFGATVTGFLPSRLTASDAKALYQGLVDYAVLVFKDVELDVRTHVALGEVFGELDPPHTNVTIRHPDDPRVRVLAANGGKPVAVDDPEADKLIGHIPWHADGMYKERPNRGAVLRPIVIPEEGGQTGWIDLALAYRTLPRELKAKIQGLRIVHSYEASHARQSMVGGAANILPSTIHPLVFVHPENDLPVLNVSPGTALEIVGLPKEEGDPLLKYLIAHATRDDDAFVHSWAPGEAAAWDNWRTLHSALGHPKRFPRVMNSLQLQSTFKLGQVVTEGAAPQDAMA
jgi:taurine dioxygenase